MSRIRDSTVNQRYIVIPSGPSKHSECGAENYITPQTNVKVSRKEGHAGEDSVLGSQRRPSLKKCYLSGDRNDEGGDRALQHVQRI